MSRVAGYALRQIGSTTTGTLTVSSAGATVETLMPTRPIDLLTVLPGTTEGGSDTGRTDPDGVFPTLGAPYWYAENDLILLGVVRSRATASDYPRARPYGGDWVDIYPVSDDVQFYDGASWGTVTDGTLGFTVRALTNPRTLDYAYSMVPYDYRGAGYAQCLGHHDHSDYAGFWAVDPPSVEADDKGATYGYDLPAWPAASTDYVRLRHWYEADYLPPLVWELEGAVPSPVTVDVSWFWEWWGAARVWGPTGCDDWTDTPQEPDSGESVSLIADPCGYLWRTYLSNGDIYVQRKTRSDASYTTRGHWTGAHPSLSQDIDGTVWLLYEAGGGDINRLRVETGSETTVATGTHPIDRWAPGHAYRILTYHDGTGIVADVSDAQGNAMHGGTVTVVSPCPAQAFEPGWRLDGTIEGWYQAPTTNILTQRISADLGKTWS